MLGGNTPFFRLVYELIPGTKFFRAPSTIIYVFAFALSVLAALGTERVLARQVNHKVVIGWLAFGALIALLASGGAIAKASSGLATDWARNYAADRGIDPSAVPQIVEQVMSGNRGPLLLGAWRSFFFLACAAVGVLGYLRAKVNGRALVVALLSIIALDLWSIERKYWLFSPRANGQGYGYATSFSFPIVELFNLYLPQYTGMIDTMYYGPNNIHWHSEYIGGTVLMLASLALGRASRRSFRRFWLGTLAIATLWMLGGNTPFFHLVYELIPGTKFFRAPSTIIYVFAFALSVLAALGTERVLARQINQKVVLAWLAFGALIALLASGGAIATASSGLATDWARNYAADRGIDPSAVPQLVEQVMSGNRGPLLLGAWRSFFFVACAAVGVLGYLRAKVNGRALVVALLSIIALDLWSIERKYWMFSPPARVLYASDAAIEHLKRDPQPARVAVVALSDSGVAFPDPYFGNDRKGKGTGLMVHGIRSITGYHGNELGRYQQLSEFRTAPGAPPALFSPTFFRHENVRYLYTNAAVADTAMKLVVGPIRNSAGSTV